MPERLILRNHVPTLDYVLADGGTDITAQVEQLQAASGADAFVVKPEDGNASEGIHWVPTAAAAVQVVGDGHGGPGSAGRGTNGYG